MQCSDGRPFLFAACSSLLYHVLTRRPLDKSAYLENSFLISQPKHMMWAHWMDKKMFTILHSKKMLS